MTNVGMFLEVAFYYTRNKANIQAVNKLFGNIAKL